MNDNQIESMQIQTINMDQAHEENTIHKKRSFAPLSSYDPNTEKHSLEPKKRRAVPMIQISAPKRDPKQSHDIVKSIMKQSNKINNTHFKSIFPSSPVVINHEDKQIHNDKQEDNQVPTPITIFEDEPINSVRSSTMNKQTNMNEFNMNELMKESIQVKEQNVDDQTSNSKELVLIHDIDSTYNKQPSFFSKYALSIYKYYRSIEGLYLPRENYMIEVQKEMTANMRSILIDWIIEALNTFHLRNETLFLTINLFDRFLSIKPVNKTQLQLIACACISLASKYEECKPLRLSQIVYLACNIFTRQQLKDTEILVMNTLQFHFTITTPYRMLKRFIIVANALSDEGFLALFILELSLLHYRFIRTLPSLLAAASLYLARSIINITPIWTDLLVEHTEYTEEMLQPVVKELRAIYDAKPQPQLTATYTKYSTKEYRCISVNYKHYKL